MKLSTLLVAIPLATGCAAPGGTPEENIAEGESDLGALAAGTPIDFAAEFNATAPGRTSNFGSCSTTLAKVRITLSGNWPGTASRPGVLGDLWGVGRDGIYPNGDLYLNGQRLRGDGLISFNVDGYLFWGQLGVAREPNSIRKVLKFPVTAEIRSVSRLGGFSCEYLQPIKVAFHAAKTDPSGVDRAVAAGRPEAGLE